ADAGNAVRFWTPVYPPAHPLFSEFGGVDSTFTTIVGGSGGNGFYVSCDQFAFLGSKIEDATGAEHCLRAQIMRRFVVANGTLKDPADGKTCLTNRGWEFSGTPTVEAGTYTEYGVICDNEFSSTQAGVLGLVGLGPTND